MPACSLLLFAILYDTLFFHFFTRPHCCCTLSKNECKVPPTCPIFVVAHFALYLTPTKLHPDNLTSSTSIFLPCILPPTNPLFCLFAFAHQPQLLASSPSGPTSDPSYNYTSNTDEPFFSTVFGYTLRFAKATGQKHKVHVILWRITTEVVACFRPKQGPETVHV